MRKVPWRNMTSSKVSEMLHFVFFFNYSHNFWIFNWVSQFVSSGLSRRQWSLLLQLLSLRLLILFFLSAISFSVDRPSTSQLCYSTKETEKIFYYVAYDSDLIFMLSAVTWPRRKMIYVFVVVCFFLNSRRRLETESLSGVRRPSGRVNPFFLGSRLTLLLLGGRPLIFTLPVCLSVPPVPDPNSIASSRQVLRQQKNKK